MIQYGDEIRKHRQAMGWTRAQLEAVTGYSETTIKRYERGLTVPTVSAYQDILGAMGKRLEVVDAPEAS